MNRRNYRRLIAVALLAFVPGSSFAGDEVDYSAPYLTVENGELVTKYPAREHPTDEAKSPASEEITSAPVLGSSLLLLLGLALAVIVLVRVVFRARKKNR